jgi:hypothetical protein
MRVVDTGRTAAFEKELSLAGVSLNSCYHCKLGWRWRKNQKRE